MLGLDVGSVSVGLVAMDPEGELVETAYVLHRGNFRKALHQLLLPFNKERVTGLATPSGKALFRPCVRPYHLQVALMKAVSHLDIPARSILHVGAERFFLMELDREGGYLQTSHSSSCAAGTGSFLDQQALRLGLPDTASLSEMALRNNAPVPDIAARCSVFAKTDLIHAQQKGYGLEAICDSLCKGLADNISDTLFNKTVPESPVVMTGGVAMNRSVVSHLQRMIGKEIQVHPLSHLFPALGAARLFLEDGPYKDTVAADPEDILAPLSERQYYYGPLTGGGSGQSGGALPESYRYQPRFADHTMEVQVDLFGKPAKGEGEFHLGIDVGSTSTKAVWVDKAGDPVAGFYTYTSGQPLKAVQALFEAMEHHADQQGIRPVIISCGTTGSGRKFIGTILGADMDVDEITAHARAAYALHPETDTIIEIGGQDAKFTQMKDGVVTFSHMNTVCAAGTGSFLEELAGRLGVPLEEFEVRAMGQPAPLASDRCTVFMERDINQLLSNGYAVEEVLATMIHSVRENYLKKVASESHIGDHICFQGATARNRALVAAFEQRLGKPVVVSPLCHLTGALGTALILLEEHRGRSRFRGLGLYKKKIPVRTEVCDLCLNRCTISIATVNGDTQAYGFLCGRDYQTRKFVRKGTTGFELLKERKKLLPVQIKRGSGRASPPGVPVIGIPSTLHLTEDLPFWTAFFSELSIPWVTSEGYKESLKAGKKIAGAEFCAPIDAMYGHIAHLSGECDLVFMPVYLESRTKPGNTEENFCYYTQFSASLAFQEGDAVRSKLLSPMLNFNRNGQHNARVLQGTLREAGYAGPGLAEVSGALRKASEIAGNISLKLRELFSQRFDPEKLSVVLLGRPYVVLSETLNKGIPDIFTAMGIDAWYQDMLPIDHDRDEALNRLLRKIPWHFAANILRAADQAARTRNLYPVLITAFKCAPDSFITEYFKQLMHLCGKPYLIIQIDEHDSNVGYETRIEAALRSFRNHAAGSGGTPEPDLNPMLPRIASSLNGKILLLPNWDMFVGPLVAANLRRAGVDARVLDTDETGIRKSMVHNTGQCLPINIIAQDFIDYVEKNGLDPSRTMLWMMEGKMACNLRQYPYYIKRILENYGNGMELASVYSGEISHREMSLGVTYYVYFAYMLGGLFRKTACRIRPYELVSGQTDEVFEEVHRILVKALEGKQSIDSAVHEGLALVDTIRYDRGSRKPLVAIFGDLYVRDNDIMNQGLIRDIEEAGGEVLVTPYHDYTKIVIENIFRRASLRGEHLQTGLNRVFLNVLKFMDDKHYKPFGRFLGPAPVIRPRALERHLEKFNIHPLHSGESYDNILKIFYILENYPGVALFVQTNPSFCCPALITEAMTRRIRDITGVPVVTLTYDGTSDRRNDVVVPYIRRAMEKQSGTLIQ